MDDNESRQDGYLVASALLLYTATKVAQNQCKDDSLSWFVFSLSELDVRNYGRSGRFAIYSLP